ncbi:MAG: tetratricopeptide repeat protein [Bacteroidales bacterium]|nr:tetratricopeptide repeat protein [Bacteroidales bacterium]
MNRSLLIASAILIFLVLSSTTNNQENHSFLVFGVIKHQDQKLGGVSVKVFENGKLWNEVVTGRNVGYGFTLQYNTAYRIELMKEGYLKEVVLIDTKVPEEVIAYGDRILWEPDFKMHKTMPGLRLEGFQKPVARYIFDPELWGFYEDSEYTESVEPYRNEVLLTLNMLQESAYLKEKERGDSFLGAENFEGAILSYTLAGQYQPENKELEIIIKDTRKLLKKKIDSENAYQTVLQKADEFFRNEKYSDANQFYQRALIYKPGESYPLDQLYTIDSIRSYDWLTRVRDYEQLILKADTLINEGNYNLAVQQAKEAIRMFPDKKEAKYLLARIDSLRELQKAEPGITEAARKDIPDEFTAASGTPQNKDTILADKPEKLIPGPIAEGENLRQRSDRKGTPDSELKAEPGKPQKKEPSPEYQSTRHADLFEKPLEESVEILKRDLKARQVAGDKSGTSSVLEELGQVYQDDFQYSRALESYSKSLQLKREIGDVAGEIDVLNGIASVMYDSGSYYVALQNFEQSFALASTLDDKQKSSDILSNMAVVYENSFRFNEALEKLKESRQLKEETGDLLGVSGIQKSIGNIYIQENDFRGAAEAISKSVAIARKLNNEDELASGLNSLGAAYYGMHEYNEAAKYYTEALSVINKTDNLQEKSLALNNLGNIRFSNKQYAEAITFYEQSLTIKRDLNFREGIATSLFNIGNSYYMMKEYPRALEYFTASIEIAREAKYFEVEWLNYEAFARTYAAMGNYKDAYRNYKLYTTEKFESEKIDLQLVEFREQYESSKLAVKNLRKELRRQSRIARYEAEKNQRELQIVELEVRNKKQQLKRQQLITTVFITVSSLILLFLLVIMNQFRLTRKAYRLVEVQKKNITEGINYAARIQRAVSPPDSYIQTILPEHFILNKPCEVVGGDFYWIARHHQKTVIAVSDCTGHGVPGGFMSMLGIALLNEIISTEEELQSHEILTQLRKRVVESLHQQASGSEALDGMDISLIILDSEKMRIQFSAAYHSLYLIRNGEFEKIKGDRIPIGYHHRPKPFTSQVIQLSKGDLIYLSTDGYADQIGKKTNRRFMFNAFKEILLKVKDLPLSEQMYRLNSTIESWKGKLPQTDDILVMGIRM